MSQSFDFSGVDKQVASRIEPFCEALIGISGEEKDSLISAYLIGPAARGEYLDNNPDIQLVLIYETISIDLLNGIAALGKRFGSKGLRAPLLLTLDYLSGGQDVFPMEFLDLSRAHICLYGANQLADILVDREHLRLQVERELRTWRVQLRQNYLRAAGDETWLAKWFQERVTDVFPVLRASLDLLGGDAYAGNTDTVKRLVSLAPIDGDAFITVWERHKAGKTIDRADVRRVFEAWLISVGKLVETIDAL